MPFIHLTTFIAAPLERVFDLSRSVDVHKASMQARDEKVIDGVFNGLMNEGEVVTWEAKHLFKKRRLKVKITKLQRPGFFVDEQVQGDFKMMKHEHYFKAADNGTIMIDQFHFEVRGFVAKTFASFYLKKYMTALLNSRNQYIKETAEGKRWTQYLNR